MLHSSIAMASWALAEGSVNACHLGIKSFKPLNDLLSRHVAAFHSSSEKSYRQSQKNDFSSKMEMLMGSNTILHSVNKSTLKLILVTFDTVLFPFTHRLFNHIATAIPIASSEHPPDQTVLSPDNQQDIVAHTLYSNVGGRSRTLGKDKQDIW